MVATRMVSMVTAAGVEHWSRPWEGRGRREGYRGASPLAGRPAAISVGSAATEWTRTWCTECAEARKLLATISRTRRRLNSISIMLIARPMSSPRPTWPLRLRLWRPINTGLSNLRLPRHQLCRMGLLPIQVWTSMEPTIIWGNQHKPTIIRRQTLALQGHTLGIWTPPPSTDMSAWVCTRTTTRCGSAAWLWWGGHPYPTSNLSRMSPPTSGCKWSAMSPSQVRNARNNALFRVCIF